jgi:methylaspartate mutase epsilon subunit
VADELDWILREVDELVAPVLAGESRHGGLHRAIAAAFADGTLDIPFSAGRHARSELIPGRAEDGAIRILSPGSLPLSAALRERHSESLRGPARGPVRRPDTGHQLLPAAVRRGQPPRESPGGPVSQLGKG